MKKIMVNTISKTEQIQVNKHENKWTEIANYIKNTSYNIEEIKILFDLDETYEEIESDLISLGIDRCQKCGMWMGAFLLIDDNQITKNCDNCQNKDLKRQEKL